MRILLVQDAEWRKKGPHHQHHLMELLSLRGHKIVVIGFDQLWRKEKGGLISSKETVYNVSRFYKGSDITYIRPCFIRLPLLDYISFLFSSRNEIDSQIKEFKPDVIIGFSSLLSNFWGMIYAKKNEIPFVYYWYDIIHDLNVPKQFRLVAILLEKIIVSKSTAILVINEALKDYLVDFGANPSIVEVKTGGIDQNRFNPENFDRKIIRNEFGFRDLDLVLFFMGWIYEFSGLDQIVIELSKLGNSASRIKLLIVGEGDHYHKLKALVKEYSLEDRVILTGKKPYEDIPKLIATSDICLLPAIDNEVMRYIVPIKMYEYLAMLKPVISTELPGVVKEFGYNNGVLYIKRPEDVIKKALGLTAEDISKNSEQANIFINNYKWNYLIDEFELYLNNLIRLNSN